MRYDTAKIKKDKDGVRYYRPTIVPNIPIKDSDIFVFPVYGERFDNIAQKYYGDVNLWWYIAKANNLTFMTIPIGTSLRIPQDARYAIGK